MFETIAGSVLLLLGCYQLYTTRNVFVYTKKHGNKSISAFLPLGLYSGALMGFVFLGFGVALTFHLIKKKKNISLLFEVAVEICFFVQI